MTRNNIGKIATALIIILIATAGIYLFIQPKSAETPVTTVNQSQLVVCNAPYILVGTGCCLDVNQNAICDSDETTPPALATQEQLQIPTQPSAISTSRLPSDKSGQPKLILEFQGKVSNETLTPELQQALQVKDIYAVKAIDSRFGTPVALATITMSNDESQTAQTDKYGIARVNVTRAGITNLTAYKETFNKSVSLMLNTFENYDAGSALSYKGKNAKVDAQGKWTAWSYENDQGKKVVILKDTQLGVETEFNSSVSNFDNAKLEGSYLLFENTTQEKTTLLAYHMYKRELKEIGNQSKGNYAPSMYNEQAVIVTSVSNDRGCLSDSQIEIVDTLNSPKQTLTRENHNQFALYWRNNRIYYVDLNSVLKCSYAEVNTIPVYKTNVFAYNPVKIFEIKKPTYYKLSGLDYPYSTNGDILTYVTLNSKGGTAMRTFDLKKENEYTLIDDSSTVVQRSLPYSSGNYVTWSEKAADGNWHVRIYNKATRELKWATWNSHDQMHPVLESSTIYYVQNNQIRSVSIQNE